MTDFDDPAFFGDRWAGRYHDLSQGPDPTAAVDFLAGLAPPGARVLELAIGGGRVAVPLARRGFAVEGIEASQAVVDRFRTQVDTFRNVARVLEPGGAFVCECYVPDPAAYDRQFRTDEVSEDTAGFTLTVHDRNAQVIRMQHVTVDGQGVRLLPVAHRYCWPAELDLMARLAGLERRERWAGWDRTPFGPASESHVSVYVRP